MSPLMMDIIEHIEPFRFPSSIYDPDRPLKTMISKVSLSHQCQTAYIKTLSVLSNVQISHTKIPVARSSAKHAGVPAIIQNTLLNKGHISWLQLKNEISVRMSTY